MSDARRDAIRKRVIEIWTGDYSTFDMLNTMADEILARERAAYDKCAKIAEQGDYCACCLTIAKRIREAKLG